MIGLFAKLFGLGPKSAIDHNNRGIAYGEKGQYTIVEGPLIPTNGSFVGYCDEICWMCKQCHPKPVHGGTQSMDIFYSNTGGALYSEATRPCSHAQDWTEHGVDILSPWFYGDPNNAPEPMYVALSNSTGTAAVVFHDDPGAATIDTWTEWEIDLQEFADQGVDLTNVDKIALGLGTKGSVTGTGGTGTMYFDDIRLYRPLNLFGG